MAPELEIRCKEGSDHESTTTHVREFLRSYALSIDNGPYAIDAECLPTSPGQDFNLTFKISPSEKGRIAALIPSALNTKGQLYGANFQQDGHKQMAIVLGRVKYIVQLENPKPTNQESDQTDDRVRMHGH